LSCGSGNSGDTKVALATALAAALAAVIVVVVGMRDMRGRRW
jgi:hypothetical protein